MSEAFRQIWRGPGVSARNWTWATVTGAVPLILSWLYWIVTFSLLWEVLTISWIPLRDKQKVYITHIILPMNVGFSTSFSISIKSLCRFQSSITKNALLESVKSVLAGFRTANSSHARQMLFQIREIIMIYMCMYRRHSVQYYTVGAI